MNRNKSVLNVVVSSIVGVPETEKWSPSQVIEEERRARYSQRLARKWGRCSVGFAFSKESWMGSSRMIAG